MPRSLSARCSRSFSSSDRTRGDRYFREGRVAIDGTDDGVMGTVRGSRREPYEVFLDWTWVEEDGIVEAFCDCPRFEDVGICKHVWATLLAADDQGWDGRVPGSQYLDVEPPADFGELWDADSLEADAPAWQAEDRYGGVPPPTAPLHPASSWRSSLATILRGHGSKASLDRGADVPGTRRREIYYVLDVATCLNESGLVVSLRQREERGDGTMGVVKRLSIDREELRSSSLAEDRELLQLLLTMPPATQWSMHELERESWPARPGRRVSDLFVPGPLYAILLPRLAATGRLLCHSRDQERPDPETPVIWDDGPPWRLEITCSSAADGVAALEGFLTRPDERVDLAEPELLLAEGLVLFRDQAARMDAREHFGWISALRRDGRIEIPEEELLEAITSIHELPDLPALRLPPELEIAPEEHRPEPRLEVYRPPHGAWPTSLRGLLSFHYGSVAIEPGDPRSVVADESRLLLRDRSFEAAALEDFAELDLAPPPLHESCHCLVPDDRLADVAGHLLDRGWSVYAGTEPIRRAVATRLRVSSGIDWFDLSGEVEIGSQTVPFPALLRAAREGHRLVRLGDGSHGLLPEEWIARYGSLGRLAHEETDDGLRFKPSQGILLDALLAELPSVDVDATFAKLRDKIRSFEGFEPAPEPRGFHGALRPYQKDGLGWLRGLLDLEMGGCLADDMGLGKTVQVLALLQWRRARPVPAAEKRPSIVVAPRSLVFNWIQEAGRFAPRLRVLDYTGPDRHALRELFAEHDLVVTTYGTLLRDVAELDTRFDVAVLDEAQAIKNPSTQRAKACRLLRADHRFALTGTPVENHLGDLWSIFEFLNPGLLGRLGRENLAGRTPKADKEEIAKLSRALAPFILRRTKGQVVSDLPPKTEQVLYCDLSATQRRLYDELRDHYRESLAGHVEDKGLARSKIHVLEALLRLRQAACHPGLVDPDRDEERSAKLDTLLEQMDEVLDEGHKILVFSQFTRMLGIVRRRVEDRGIPFEYLDGKTRKRQACVERFQNDPDCRVFLVSLKAGGVGLNLTAAEYVYLLDPWWNPAVETQAIDRTHRIGQSRPVFAYRLIARDTVEEKILKLQEEKRGLADAIFTGDESLMRRLTAEDLEVLLG